VVSPIALFTSLLTRDIARLRIARLNYGDVLYVRLSQGGIESR